MISVALLATLAAAHQIPPPAPRKRRGYSAEKVDPRPVDKRREVAERFRGTPPRFSLAQLFPQHPRYASYTSGLGGKIPRSFLERGTKKIDESTPGLTWFRIVTEERTCIRGYAIDSSNAVVRMMDTENHSHEIAQARFDGETTELRKLLGAPTSLEEKAGSVALAWRWSDSGFLYYGSMHVEGHPSTNIFVSFLRLSGEDEL